MTFNATVYDVISGAVGAGYVPPMPITLELKAAPRDDGKYAGEGEQLVPELEADRVNLFKATYGEEWKTNLEFAHEMVERGALRTSIDFIRLYLDEGKAKEK